MRVNPLTQIDFYKADHRRQYPAGTSLVYSNLTPRSTKHSAMVEGIDGRVVFFGLQYFAKWFLIDTWNREFFARDKSYVLSRYKRRMDGALGLDAVPVEHIAALHDLGYLPIDIRALPEGTAVPEKIPLLTIRNTRDEFFWLTNYLETILSCMLWKPCTSATTARKYRQLLGKYADITGADKDFIPFQCHDFSFRGTSGIQDAVMSGAAHLLSFVGTDTVAAIDFLEDWYGADSEKELIGCSVPATEHSVMCMDGEAGEYETFRRLIVEQYPKGFISIVSDTWDFWQVVTKFLPALRSEILMRDGKAVIRPDSGDPVKILTGDDDAPHNSPERAGLIECLWGIFGGKTTEKGYRTLDPRIGAIYGDSITLERCDEIMRRLVIKGFASSNVVLGIGSFTYEYVTRDTLGFAMKATAGIVNGQVREIYKCPKTDGAALKKSARGFLSVIRNPDTDTWTLVDGVKSLERAELGGELRPVFRDGQLLVEDSLADIRARIEASL